MHRNITPRTFFGNLEKGLYSVMPNGLVAVLDFTIFSEVLRWNAKNYQLCKVAHVNTKKYD